MRVVGTIPHSKLLITVFQMNGKFVVKFEAGGMEQVVKFTEEEVTSLEEIGKILDELFLAGVIERFNQTFLDLKRIKEKT